jgi:hypothetical protein
MFLPKNLSVPVVGIEEGFFDSLGIKDARTA